MIAYDRRGFGRSSRPWGGYDYDTLAADLNALLTELDLTNVTLVGFSMGGGEIARYIGNYGQAPAGPRGLRQRRDALHAANRRQPRRRAPESVRGMHEGMKKDRFDFLESFAKDFYGRA